MVLASFVVGMLCCSDALSRSDDVKVDPAQALLSTMLARSKTINTISLEVVVEKHPTFKQHTLRMKAKFLPDGRCYARFEHYDSAMGHVETEVVKDDKWDSIYSKGKTVIRRQLTGNFIRADLNELSDTWFPILPLLATTSDYYEKQFKASIAQDDKDYTWVRFQPRKQSSNTPTVAQIALIKYPNTVSPANFPLCIEWIEQSDATRWRITKVSINEESTVQDSDFIVEVRDYERSGWKTSRNDVLASWRSFKKLFVKD